MFICAYILYTQTFIILFHFGDNILNNAILKWNSSIWMSMLLHMFKIYWI